MRQRWFSSRAITLHVAILLWFPGCLLAGWWQVTRAFDGNGLSYLYSIEWPIFAVVGVWGWWMLIHTDPEQVGRRAQERMRLQSRTTTPETPDVPEAPEAPEMHEDDMPKRRPKEEDAALAAYNDRLAALSARGPQTWKNR